MDDGWGAVIAAVIGVIGIVVQILISMKISENNKIHTNQQDYRQNEFIRIQNLENMKFQERIENNKIDADVIAKARLDWLQEVREIEIELVDQANIFVKSINTIMDHHVRFLEFKMKNEIDKAQNELSRRNKYVDELNKSLMECKKQFLFFKLFFGSNESNNELIESAKSIIDYAELMNRIVIESFNNFGNYYMVKANRDTIFNNSDYFDEKVDNFIDKSREYNKEVWETAKKIK